MSVPPEPVEVCLDEQTVDQLARRVAELLRGDERAKPGRPSAQNVGGGKLLSAAQVAEWWGVDRAWVYAHADELGARRLGTGPRPRLRFDPDKVEQRLAPTDTGDDGDHPEAIRADVRRLHRTPGESSELLGFRVDAELSSNDPNESRSGVRNAPPTRARRTAGSTRRAAPNGTGR